MSINLALVLLPSFAYSDTVKVGAPPPTFVLINENGMRVDMESLLGKPTVMYFTHNACYYCTQIIAYLKRAEEKFGKKNIRIIGINVMAKDQKLIKAYREALEFTFPMFAGNRDDVLKAYKINYVPVLVFVDSKKNVRNVVGHYILESELHRNIKEIMER